MEPPARGWAGRSEESSVGLSPFPGGRRLKLQSPGLQKATDAPAVPKHRGLCTPFRTHHSQGGIGRWIWLT